MSMQMVFRIHVKININFSNKNSHFHVTICRIPKAL